MSLTGRPAVVIAALATALLACGVNAAPNTYRLGAGGVSVGTAGGNGEGAGDLIDAGSSGPPGADAGGLCGNDIHHVATDPPNVYFVLDTSGSMSEVLSGSSESKYQRVQAAAVALVGKMGSLINVGAALFPVGVDPNDDNSACHVGAEVLSVRAGDDDANGNGPTTQAFDSATNVSPGGSTPTAATLVQLKPLITALPGRTFVVLATDGAPNCDATAVCNGANCISNIEGCDPQFTCCGPGGNCCAPGQPAGPELCVDHDATVAAVAAIKAAGVKVYVVGVPGTQAYASVLNDMAFAGGTPQGAPPFFYQVDNLDALSSVLVSIAAKEISCDFQLGEAPKDPNYTNVYFDQKVVPFDANNGWTWTTPTTIELRGAACDELKSGAVKQVQVVSGCPTEGPK